MKSLYCVLLAVFIATPNLVSAECKPSEYAPHPYLCEAFFRCDNGVFVEFSCPSGLYFNPEISVCDWPQNVNCTSSSTTPSWNTTTTNNTFSTPINPTGTTPNFTTPSWNITTPSWNITTPSWNITTPSSNITTLSWNNTTPSSV